MIGKLPGTDTRYRTDQRYETHDMRGFIKYRLYEEGAIDPAEKEKCRLEQKQRDLRKEMEERGEIWMPRWFELRESRDDDKNANGEVQMAWRYKGGYFEEREKGFGKCVELW